MSKRSNDGDVLVNRINVGLAKQKKLLAAMLGPAPETRLEGGARDEALEEEELKEDAYGPEQLGVGAAIPKEIQDGSFTRRTVTSNDKLLQQLIGNKAAKAHIAARQAPTAAVKTQKASKFSTKPKPEESEDEDEGRAAAFKSKRSKSARSPRVNVDAEADDDLSKSSKELPYRPNESTDALSDEETKDVSTTKVATDDDAADVTQAPRAKKAKPASFLDEILAERSKKKMKKRKTDKTI